MRLTLGILVAAGLAVAGPALAQNHQSRAYHDTIDLSGGFSPDPYTLNLRTRGDATINAQAASALPGGCVGFISSAPDVQLNFRAGSLPLIISIDSSQDATLVIRAPNGQWYCDDDGGDAAFNPSIRFGQPASGAYDIWMGAYNNNTIEGTLSISEIRSF